MAHDTADGVGRERRQARRLSAPFPVTLRGTDPAGKRFQYATLLDDIGRGGFHVTLPVALDPGVRVFGIVRMTDPPGARPSDMAVLGVVVRVNPQPGGCCGVAIRFARWRFL